MRSPLDFSSWSSVLSTVLGLLLVTCLMMGIRLLFMQTVQKRRERENRQINERLKSLIAAYKTLGGSFTGTLSVSPMHLRDLRRAEAETEEGSASINEGLAERRRRIRDAVEAALSDIILLGTEEQVALAAKAAQDMVEGRPIETSALVTSLRSFIREALDLEPIPGKVPIPAQGPARPAAGGGTGRRSTEGGASGSRGGSGAGAGGEGMGMGGGLGLGAGLSADLGRGRHEDSL